MFRYRIIFADNGDYISSSVFVTRHEAAMAGVDFCRRYRAEHPEAICKWKIMSA